jgi:hypothetical protein
MRIEGAVFFISAECRRNFGNCNRESPIRVPERRQLFIRTHDETLAAIAAIMVSIVRSMDGYKPPFPIPKTQSAFVGLLSNNRDSEQWGQNKWILDAQRSCHHAKEKTPIEMCVNPWL